MPSFQRPIRIAAIFAKSLLLALALATSPSFAAPPDTDGFQQLFNGKDLSGWQTTGNWNVGSDGVVSLDPKSSGFRLFPDLKKFLWCSETYGDFVLKLEFKVAPSGRSGVFIRCSSRSKYLEVQIAERAPAGEKITWANCGGLVYHAPPLKNAANPAGQWSNMTIVCEGPNVKVEVNDDLVIDHDLSSSTKTKDILNGRLGFQNQGHAVSFRNVRIKRLGRQKQ